VGRVEALHHLECNTQQSASSSQHSA
jgi:hypothetical protein